MINYPLTTELAFSNMDQLPVLDSSQPTAPEIHILVLSMYHVYPAFFSHLHYVVPNLHPSTFKWLANHLATNAVLRSFSDAPFRGIISKSDLNGVILTAEQQQQLAEIVYVVAGALASRIKIELHGKPQPEFIHLDRLQDDLIYIWLSYPIRYN